MNNDLISRSALCEEYEDYILICESGGLNTAHEMLEAAREFPAVDAAPVRHGRWISEVITKPNWKGRMRDYYQACSCPFCHEPDPGHGVSNYCPNCGAKMDAEVQNDA